MSLILEALKKSEAERKEQMPPQDAAPTLPTLGSREPAAVSTGNHQTGTQQRRPWEFLFTAIVIVVVGIGLAVYSTQRPTKVVKEKSPAPAQEATVDKPRTHEALKTETITQPDLPSVKAAPASPVKTEVLSKPGRLQLANAEDYEKRCFGLVDA